MGNSFKVDAGNGQTVRITQNAGDLKAGVKANDLTRISAYGGNKGVHTGSNSQTLGRHGQPFNSK